MKIIRQLSEKEQAALAPEIQAYAAGVQAAERLERMVSLIVEEGEKLDLQTMQIIASEDE